jgi:hypothetical protein
VEADGNGGFVTDQLIFTSTADLAGSLVTFSFLGATDPTAFQASGLFTLDTFLKQRTSAGDVALAPASFAGVTYAAESETYTFSNFSFTPTGGAVFAVPEPATWASLAAGLLLLAGLRRRREA